MNRTYRTAGATVAMLLAVPAAAQVPAASTVVINEAAGVPVFPGDPTGRPHDVIGVVEAGVRKATLFSKAASEAKIYRELWERAERLGADAVINARFGRSHITAFSWGQTNASGTAIRFKTAHPAPELPSCSLSTPQ